MGSQPATAISSTPVPGCRFTGTWRKVGRSPSCDPAPFVPGASWLTKSSTALVDQVRSIDKQRICRRYGLVSVAELEAMNKGLDLYLGLEPEI